MVLGKEHPHHDVLEHEKHDDERNIDPAHGSDDAPYGPQYRFRRLVEKQLHPGQGGSRLHPEPTQERRRKHDEPQIELDGNTS